MLCVFKSEPYVFYDAGHESAFVSFLSLYCMTERPVNGRSVVLKY